MSEHMEVHVAGIELHIGSSLVTLSVEDAKALRDQLNAIFGPHVEYVYPNCHPELYWDDKSIRQPPRPTEVWCADTATVSNADKKNSWTK